MEELKTANITNCFVRACVFNTHGNCSKYASVEKMLQDFQKGGGCAFTWYFSGRLPGGK